MNLTALCFQLPQWVIGVVFVAYMILEYVLGKTQLGSVLGTIENTIKGLLGIKNEAPGGSPKS